MNPREKTTNNHQIKVLFILFVVFVSSAVLSAEGFTIPNKKWGICFGNSSEFTGLRFNLVDRNISTINGINVTFWKAKDEEATGTVNGLSLGVMPYAENLNGIQLGILGSGAKNNITGISPIVELVKPGDLPRSVGKAKRVLDKRSGNI